MIKCLKCNSEIPNASIYCKYCGTWQGKTVTEEFSVAADDVIKRVGDILHEGNITRIVVKDEAGKLLLEIPATVGVDT